MAERKERSSLFRFFYAVIRVVFLPISFVFYILKHPFWVLGLLFVIGCGFVYYPMSQGVKFEEVSKWYQNKYTKMKLDVMSVALEKSDGAVFSNEMLADLAEEVSEQQGQTSEGFNAKISRDATLKEKTYSLKKRGGFKRKDNVGSSMSSGVETSEGEDKPISGGLEAIFQGNSVEKLEERTESDVLRQPEISEVLPLSEDVEKKSDETELDEFGLF